MLRLSNPETLASGDRVQIIARYFEVSDRKARTVISPATGEEIKFQLLGYLHLNLVKSLKESVAASVKPVKKTTKKWKKAKKK